MSTSRFETSSGRTVWGRGAFGIALTLGLALGLTRQRPALPEEIAR